MDILFELFEEMPRQGPGTDQSTIRAYSILQNLPPAPRILDVGCGGGKQSLALAQAGNGTITAVDLHPPFLNALMKSARDSGLEQRISVVNASMHDMPFNQHSFDVIWSEGAIYIMGFEQGLQNWDPFLVPGGYIVVSEITWLKKNPPREIEQFWSNAYPGISTIQDNIERAQRCGYRLRGFFTLPEEGWWEEFYIHLENRIAELKNTYANDTEALEILTNEEQEIAYYSKFSEWYGYVFYILEKGH